MFLQVKHSKEKIYFYIPIGETLKVAINTVYLTIHQVNLLATDA